MARTLRAVVIAVVFQLGYSQDLPGAPICAGSCTRSALSAVGCGIVDLSCRCGGPGAAAALQAGPCLLGACNGDELKQLSSANSAICSSFNSGFVTKLALTTSSPIATSTAQGAAPAAAAASAAGRESSTESTSSLPETTSARAVSSSQSQTSAATTKPTAITTAAPSFPMGLGDSDPGELVSAPVNATSGISAMTDEGARAVIGLGGALSGALGFGSIYLAMMRRKRQREQARLKALADKEAPPIDELAEFVRMGGGDLDSVKVDGDEKKARHKTVNLTPEGGPLELDVPPMPQELPGALLRHEMP